MAEVIVTTSVQQGTDGELHMFEKVYDMDFLPSEEDTFYIGRGGEEDFDIPAKVVGRYWDERGDVVLQLPRYIQDPETDTEVPIYQSWYSSEDGNLAEKLTACGWKRVYE